MYEVSRNEQQCLSIILPSSKTTQNKLKKLKMDVMNFWDLYFLGSITPSTMVWRSNERDNREVRVIIVVVVPALFFAPGMA